MTIAPVRHIWILILAVLFVACQESAVTRQLGSTKDMYPDHESWGSTLRISENGLLVAVADSDRMVKDTEQDVAYLIGSVSVDFYNEQGLHMSHLSADSAEVNSRNNTMSAFGQIVVKSDEGQVLETETLRWDDTYNMVATSDSVMFTTIEKDTLYGVGFESDVDLTHWAIHRPSGVTERGFSVDD